MNSNILYGKVHFISVQLVVRSSIPRVGNDNMTGATDVLSALQVKL